MINEVIKKVRIPQATLPAIDSNVEGYILKYRIVSQDKNRTSHWSPVQIIKPEYTFEVGNIHASKTGNLATVAWDAVKVKKSTNLLKVESDYDIWLKWDKGDSGDWIYKQRLSGTSLSFPVPTTYYKNGIDQSAAPNKLTIEIYIKGSPVVRGDGTPLATGTKFLKVYQVVNLTV